MIPVGGGQTWSEPLLEHCALGDEVAWSRLYLRYESATRRFLYRLGVPLDQVEDACQDVFLEVYRYLPSFRGDCSFKTWLYRLCVTQARKSRSKARVFSVLKSLIQANKPHEAIYGDVSDQRAEELIQGALASLSNLERTTFVLFELEGMSGAEVAQVGQCPEATVWRRLHEARKKFKAYVHEHAGAP